MYSLLQKKPIVQVDPYPHIVIEDALPWDLYEELENNFPESQVLNTEPFDNGICYRMKANRLLHPDEDIPEVWKKFTQYHTSAEWFNEVNGLFKPFMPNVLQKKFTENDLGARGCADKNKNIWTDPKTGESFLVKNKAKRGEINIGFDSVKMIEKTLAKRLEGAKLNTKEIKKIGKELGWDQKKITKYIETSEQAKRTLESLIKDLNKGEGRTMWSLGHRRAVKTQAHSADRITNIELEPLVDVLTEAGRTIKGNTGRAANDELIDILSKITNNPADLKADMIHWGDSLVGNFMPRMREITDAKSFFEEIVKREDFINKVESLAKKNTDNISWEKKLEIAGDEVMHPLMKNTKVFEETFFDIRSNGF